MKVNRFKIEVNNDEDIKLEIEEAAKAIGDLGECPYVKRVAKILGLKDYELIKIVKDLKIKTYKGCKTGKTIIA